MEPRKRPLRQPMFLGLTVSNNFRASFKGSLTRIAWVDNGGVVGRGILIDIASYAERNNLTFPAFESTVIPLDLIKKAAVEQGVSFRPGDILFIRVGFTKAYEKLSVEEGIALGQRPVSRFVGIESSEATLRWLWENQFAAVASDAVAVESSPVDGPQVPPEWSLHQWCLAGWGLPLGEMFYLEKLAIHCAEKKRWTFFFSSVPLNVSCPALVVHGFGPNLCRE
ncbi:hypothetical protein EIK77_003854 [Talaromyces pinophilus]|nr:hypothetical protein EIK77_003854 [Talaromyces pinophilus]